MLARIDEFLICRGQVGKLISSLQVFSPITWFQKANIFSYSEVRINIPCYEIDQTSAFNLFNFQTKLYSSTSLN